MRSLLLAILLGSILCFGQQPEVPHGIKLKAASAADNAAAKLALQHALTDGSVPAGLLGETVTCGPALWAALKPSAGDDTLHAKILTVVLPAPIALTVPGR